MKTTVDIAGPLLRKAKELAARRGVTLRVVIEEALREAVEPSRSVAKPPEFRLHSFEGEGLQPGVEWGDWASVRDLSYEGRGG